MIIRETNSTYWLKEDNSIQLILFLKLPLLFVGSHGAMGRFGPKSFTVEKGQNNQSDLSSQYKVLDVTMF